MVHKQNNGTAQYTANGQPSRIGQREYVWDALGQLVQVRQQDHTLASYTYSHRGERISKTANGQTSHTLYNEAGQISAELNAQGLLTRQYVYLADQAIAVIDTPQGKALSNNELLTHDSLGLEAKNILNIWWQGMTTRQPERMVWLHANHLGAPQAATGQDGQLLWQAHYAAFGAASISPGGASPDSANFMLNLRLPGQYFDAETGLHYNRHRYYDPSRGEYLTPDPLGTPDGPNPYAYVRYNPLKYIDPEGLVLFAFDGTGNDESNDKELSNIVAIRDLYDSGDAYYITGVGTLDPRSGIENPWFKGGNLADSAGSITGKERIAFLVTNLNSYSNDKPDDEIVDIDVVGFSRGAAEARDFANQIVANTKSGWYSYKDSSGQHCQKVNFRFMGLFDTVLSVHSGSYALNIPQEFAYVAQAVAMNEYRNLFPVVSIAQGQSSAAPTVGQTRIERGFLGSHSDIGGSFADGDLAKVAMVWMVNQATAAGVTMKTNQLDTTIIANPVIHDKSSNLYASSGPAPTAYSEDRVIRFGDGSSPRQRSALVGTGTGYDDTTPFITYSASPTGNVAGTVDMKAYLQWLNKNQYGINMTVN